MTLEINQTFLPRKEYGSSLFCAMNVPLLHMQHLHGALGYSHCFLITKHQ